MPAATNVVRVDLARLDDLMRLVGDMVVTRSRLEDTLNRVEPHVPFQEWRALQDHSGRIERTLRDLREGVMRVRLVPVGEIFRDDRVLAEAGLTLPPLLAALLDRFDDPAAVRRVLDGLNAAVPAGRVLR